MPNFRKPKSHLHHLVDRPPFEVTGAAARFEYAHPNDDFAQAEALYRTVMTDMDRDHLIGNIADHLGKAQASIQLRQCALFYKADPDYGRRVAQGLSLDIEEVKRLAGTSAEQRVATTAR